MTFQTGTFENSAFMYLYIRIQVISDNVNLFNPMRIHLPVYFQTKPTSCCRMWYFSCSLCVWTKFFNDRLIIILSKRSSKIQNNLLQSLSRRHRCRREIVCSFKSLEQTCTHIVWKCESVPPNTHRVFLCTWPTFVLIGTFLQKMEMVSPTVGVQKWS